MPPLLAEINWNEVLADRDLLVLVAVWANGIRGWLFPNERPPSAD